MKRNLLLILAFFSGLTALAQRNIHGSVLNAATGEALAGATVQLSDSSRPVVCDGNGKFSIQPGAAASLHISATGYATKTFYPALKDHVVILLEPLEKEIDAVVVTGTMRAVKKL